MVPRGKPSDKKKNRPLPPHIIIDKKKKKKEKKRRQKQNIKREPVKPFTIDKSAVQFSPPPEQAHWLTNTFHSAFGSFLSPLELDPIPDDCLVQLSEERDRSCESLSWHVKSMIGPSWQESLCKRGDSSIREKGSPVLLILCSSAVRCVELLKGLRNLTKECKAAKLFAKHFKVEEQVVMLEEHVNIAAGTPNRVKKLVDLGALGLNHLAIVLLDLHQDVKGLTLFTVPQVKSEFWELYKEHFHQCVLERRLQLCLY